jgi:hypothetical protein
MGRPPVITYEFAFEDGSVESWSIDLARPASTGEGLTLPAWTALDYHQCKGCPLSVDEHPRCPAAVDAVDVLEHFKAVYSYETATVTVKLPERTVVKHTDLQTALQSVIGLIMATSGCPVLRQLKAMAHHHLPFSSPSETLYRTVSNHLLKLYLHKRRGHPLPDDQDELDSLLRLYEELLVVNGAFVKRITKAAEKDANLNALVLLFTISALVQASLEEGLEELDELYR